MNVSGKEFVFWNLPQFDFNLEHAILEQISYCVDLYVLKVQINTSSKLARTLDITPSGGDG